MSAPCMEKLKTRYTLQTNECTLYGEVKNLLHITDK
jgi:hypothetical protein